MQQHTYQGVLDYPHPFMGDILIAPCEQEGYIALTRYHTDWIECGYIPLSSFASLIRGHRLLPSPLAPFTQHYRRLLPSRRYPEITDHVRLTEAVYVFTHWVWSYYKRQAQEERDQEKQLLYQEIAHLVLQGTLACWEETTFSVREKLRQALVPETASCPRLLAFTQVNSILCHFRRSE